MEWKLLGLITVDNTRDIAQNSVRLDSGGGKGKVRDDFATANRGVGRLAAIDFEVQEATRDFGVDVRAGSSDQVDTSFGGGFEEFLVAKDAFSGKVSRLALVERPMGVERNAVVAKRLDLLEDVCR